MFLRIGVNFAVFLDSGMAISEELFSVVASVYSPHYFCNTRNITTIALFKIIFKYEIYCLDTFCSFLFNTSGLVCQNVLLLFILIVTSVSISVDNHLRHVPLKEVLCNFFMILPTVSHKIFETNSSFHVK